jgi:hypothetical protein
VRRTRGGASTIVIPSWMDKSAPDAAEAEAARTIGAGPLSASQRHRLQRLTSDATQSAWIETLRRRSGERGLKTGSLQLLHIQDNRLFVHEMLKHGLECRLLAQTRILHAAVAQIR